LVPLNALVVEDSLHSTGELERVAQGTQTLETMMAKLRENERITDVLLEGVTDYAIFMLDPEGRVTTWNKGAERIKGYTPDEIIGQHFSIFYPPEARQDGLPERVLATAAKCGRFEAEDWRIRKDGSRFWANVTIDAIHDEDGELVGFAKITRDLTERRDMEDKVRHAQRLESVGQLTSGIAHDFNNMLTIIIGNLELLERLVAQGGGPTQSAAATRAIRLAMNGGLRASALTRRLLAFARQQTLAPERVHVDRFVRRIADLLDRLLGESITIHTEASTGNSIVLADPTELENAVLNLAVNSRDAMPRGGKLTLASSIAKPALVSAETGETVESPHVVISVSDTGSGMSPEILAHAFDPFFTTKEVGRGTGLGLSQVYGFIKQSGGQVLVNSQPGCGTVVKLYLPKLGKQIGDEFREEPDTIADRLRDGSGTVLVVEDDDGVRAFSTEALRNLGYSVLEALDAGSALEMLEYRPDIKLLFTDVGLPGVMNGWQLSDEVRKRRPRLKVLVTTGYLTGVHTRPPAQNRFISIIAKPYGMTDLAEKIRMLLDN
jgi:PAS domain S-box-containing protein